MASFSVRSMRKEDVPEALDICREACFQEGTRCLYTWLKVDPQGFHVAVLQTGEVIGVCCAIRHHEDLAFVGLYAVREKYRGIGAGIAVWNECMGYIGSRNAALNAVPSKLELYRDRGGFPIVEENWVTVVNLTNERRLDASVLSDKPPQNVSLESFHSDLLQAIYDYDLALMGYDRKLALELNCKEGDSRTYVAMKDDRCVGFGTIKITCHNAGKVGPLYADNGDIAEVLLRRLIDALPQATGFAMMTISSNEAARKLIRRLDCPSVEHDPRLYRKAKHNVNTDKVFAQFDINYSPY